MMEKKFSGRNVALGVIEGSWMFLAAGGGWF